MAAILIIEDDQALLDTLELLLRHHGHQVYTATTGSFGLQLFYRNRPELVFLDIGLPDQSGIDVLGQIQQQDPALKVVVITAFRQLDVYAHAMNSGAWGYLCKPLDAHHILQTVEMAMAAPVPLGILPGTGTIGNNDRHACFRH